MKPLKLKEIEKMKRLINFGVLAVITLVISGNGALAETVKFNTPADRAASANEITGFLKKPASDGPFPAIVLLHTCGGIMDHVSKDWPNFLVELGYAALTVDTFGSRGKGGCPNGIRHGVMRADALGALNYLGKQPFIDKKRIGVFGFSKGGIVVNMLAKRWMPDDSLKYRVGVSFYGICKILLGKEGDILIPLMAIFGDEDTEMEGCDELKENALLKVSILEDAYHNFDVEETSDRTNSLGTDMYYSREATEKAKKLVKAFLDQHMGK
jgi:dienelactone hydrolase